jgi:SAM-dependent methyltransferase
LPSEAVQSSPQAAPGYVRRVSATADTTLGLPSAAAHALTAQQRVALQQWAASQGLSWSVKHEQLPPDLVSRYVTAGPDWGLLRFQQHCVRSRAGWLRSTAHRCLRPFMSDFDINGLLDMYPMHLLSTEQASALLGKLPGHRLLDVGAGSGDVTAALAPLFSEVVAIEAARAMRWRLGRRGYQVDRPEALTDACHRASFDVVACLNVLDRTHQPVSLLRSCAQTLASGGRLLLSVPLPYCPLVYEGGLTVEPLAPLPLGPGDWEAEFRALCEVVLPHAGLEVLHWTKLPYLSGGDHRQPWYVLDAAVVCCGQLSPPS